MARLIDTLDKLANAQLAAVYNEVSDRKVSKFSDHSTAVKRTLAALEAAGRTVVVTGDAVSVVPLEEAPPSDTLARVITLVATENPKGMQSKSWQRFQFYTTGMTVGDYLARVKEWGGTRRLAMRDIAWDTAHGYISVK